MTPEGMMTMTMALAMKELGASSTVFAASIAKVQSGVGLRESRGEFARMGLNGSDLTGELKSNPLEFAEKLRTAFSARGIDPGNVTAVAAEIKKLFRGMKDDGATAIAQVVKAVRRKRKR